MATVEARAPGRVSLAGGGTDLPAYYERHGGAVVSFAIDSYAHGRAEPRAAGLELVSLDAGVREVIPAASFARRMRPPILAEEFLVYQKAVAWHFGIERGLLAVSSEIPPGAGLASSGAVSVALVRAAAALVGEEMERATVAETAALVEIEILRRSCGKQDQYASAFGGLNLIEFFRDGSVDVTPLRLPPETTTALERRIMLFHNGARRSSVSPLQEQTRRSAGDPETVDALHRLKEMAYEMVEVLERADLDGAGELLHRAWEAKQHLNSQVSTPEITRVYALARRAGAIGGKLAGAGLGGTLVLYCPEEQQQEVRRMLASQGWRQRPARIDWDGSVLRTDTGAEDEGARG